MSKRKTSLELGIMRAMSRNIRDLSRLLFRATKENSELRKALQMHRAEGMK